MNPVNQNLKQSKELKQHHITLYVNTELLKYKKDTDKYATFGQAKGISNKLFTVDVLLNDDIIWLGESSTSPGKDSVLIKEIKFKKGKKILNKDILRGEKVVSGKVDKGTKGDQESYIIYFEFLSESNPQKKIFKIDPILRII
jgi:hypothetical protein